MDTAQTRDALTFLVHLNVYSIYCYLKRFSGIVPGMSK